MNASKVRNGTALMTTALLMALACGCESQPGADGFDLFTFAAEWARSWLAAWIL